MCSNLAIFFDFNHLGSISYQPESKTNPNMFLTLMQHDFMRYIIFKHINFIIHTTKLHNQEPIHNLNLKSYKFMKNP